MTSIRFTAAARRDGVEIIRYLKREAGARTAALFERNFDAFYLRIVRHPRSCAVRLDLGPSCHVGLVRPYLVIYDYDDVADAVTVLRLLHGRRRVATDFESLP